MHTTTKTISLAFLVTTLSLSLTACGGTVDGSGGGGAGGGAGAGPTAQSYCEGKVAREKKCDTTTTATVAACVADADTQCMFTGFRADVRAAIVTCLNDRPCNTGDDACYYEPGLASPAAGQEAFIAACQAKVAACDSFKDDYCTITVLSSSAYTALSACLDSACGGVGACIDGVLQGVCPGI